MIRFILNENEVATELPPGMLLLDFIRYHCHLTGTKIGCREGDCGACTVLTGAIVNDDLQYRSATSCLMPLGNAQGKHIVTIEGINFANTLNPVQQAMADVGATQCGFCTPGFVMSLAGFCLSKKEATAQNAIAAIDGNICRCTGYKSIERAAGKIAEIMNDMAFQKVNNEEVTTILVKNRILPAYFAGIKDKLQILLQPRLTTNDYRLSSCFTGGGTDLYVQKHDEMTHSDIRFLFDEPDLKGIIQENNKCMIGASLTVSDLMESAVIKDVFPGFNRYARLISSTPIRNMATVAGNLVNASPIGDLTIFFLALDAKLSLISNSSPGGEGSVRTLPLRKLYKGYKTLDKEPEEMISKIWFDIPEKNSYFNFEKVSKRTHLDIASVNSAICITMNENKVEKAGISAGGVGPVPMYLRETSEFLNGKMVSADLIQEAIEVMKTEISPISDARGSKEYKTLLLAQLIKAHFMTLSP